jgi:chromosome segregation ATPase
MSITTNGELSSILLQKTNQIAALQQELSKVTSELEFYRNRNKELEGVVSRTEKRFKEIEHNYV